MIPDYCKYANVNPTYGHVGNNIVRVNFEIYGRYISLMIPSLYKVYVYEYVFLWYDQYLGRLLYVDSTNKLIDYL
jgi:hypothetical protein